MAATDQARQQRCLQFKQSTRCIISPTSTQLNNRWMVTAVIIACLIIAQTRHTILSLGAEECLFIPAARSQHVLYSKFLVKGYASAPSSLDKGKRHSTYQGLAQIAVMLLLAGDIELNPGPHTWLSTNMDSIVSHTAQHLQLAPPVSGSTKELTNLAPQLINPGLRFGLGSAASLSTFSGGLQCGRDGASDDTSYWKRDVIPVVIGDVTDETEATGSPAARGSGSHNITVLSSPISGTHHRNGTENVPRSSEDHHNKHMTASLNSKAVDGLTSEDKGTDFKSTFSKKGLHFLHLNVRRLLPKIEEIRQLVKQLKIGVICLTESWLDETISDEEIAINNYCIVRKDRNRKGGGVCVYVRSEVAFNCRDDIASDLEIVWMDICLPKTNPILLGACYRPHGHSTFF